jgi:hypothetical protein
VAGPPGHGRLAHAAFIGSAFTAAQWAGDAALILLNEPRTVVTAEQDQGVFRQLQFPQRVENPTGAPIDFLDPVAIFPVF